MNRREFLRYTGVAGLAVFLKSCTSPAVSVKQGDREMKSEPAGQKGPMIAACGLNCDDCSIRKAAKDKEFANKLATQWRQAGNEKVTADWFKCEGCHGRDDLVWSGDCGIRACCVKKKHLSNCSQCGEFPCPLINAFANDGMPRHAKAVEYLRSLREQKAL